MLLLSLRSLLLSNERQKMDLKGRDGGGGLEAVEVGETVTMYSMKKESTFNKKEK